MENIDEKNWASRIFGLDIPDSEPENKGNRNEKGNEEGKGNGNIETGEQEDFTTLSLEAFHYQYRHCDIYRRYADGIGCREEQVESLAQIPFLPIEFFKTQRVVSFQGEAECRFYSSGTTGMTPAVHHVYSLQLYRQSFLNAFTRMVGNPKDFVFLALLPSYLEREGSSLIYMVQTLMEESGAAENRFYLHQLDELAVTLEKLHAAGRKTILFGVTYALLDLIAYRTFHLPQLTVFETGGMKGRRKECLRSELHRQLCAGLGVEKIYSEYGMAELLSQAYTDGGEEFRCPPWMKVLIRDRYDPLRLLTAHGSKGGINVIDLANIHSCCFIATQDIGSLHEKGRFRIWGRFDQADIRGCNLLVAE